MAEPSQDDEPAQPPEVVSRGGPAAPVDGLAGLLGADSSAGGGFDLSSLLDSAQQLMSAQQEAAENEVVGSAGGGKVEVTVTGGGEFRRVRISPDVVDPDDVGLLEDLVLAALHDMNTKLLEIQREAMGPLAGLGDLFGGG